MSNSKDLRSGWVKELKVGDKVFIEETRGVMGIHTKLSYVEKITPTGRINVGGKQFPPSGKIYQNYTSVSLKQATDEAVKEFRQGQEKLKLVRNVQNIFKEMDLDKLNVSELKEIESLLKKIQGKDLLQ